MLESEITQICPRCHTPVATRNLELYILFPDQVEVILKLLERTLNIVPCPVCKKDVAFLVPLTVERRETGQILVVAPKESLSEIERVLATQIKGSFALDRCDNYDELIEKMVPWIDETIVPGLQGVTSGTFYTRPQDEQIALINPLLLALLQAQINDTLPFPVLQMSGDPSKVLKVLEGLLVAMIHDQAQNLMLEAAAKGTMSNILSMIRTHIPASTLTTKLLEYSIDKCESSMKELLSLEDLKLFAPAYRNEFVNAVLHAYANESNPRSFRWASFLRNIWLLNNDPNNKVDPAFLLTPEIVRETVRFEDLWDISLAACRRGKPIRVCAAR